MAVYRVTQKGKAEWVTDLQEAVVGFLEQAEHDLIWETSLVGGKLKMIAYHYDDTRFQKPLYMITEA